MRCAGRFGGAASALCLFGCTAQAPLSHSGFIDASVSVVASQNVGRVEHVRVRSGDNVHEGQVLAELDSREQQALVAQAQADLERAKQALRQAHANVEAATPTVRGAGADIARARAALEEAQSRFQRTTRLSEQGAAARSELDTARAQLQEAQASLESALAGKASVHGKLAAAIAAEADARASLGSAQAALDLAQVRLAQCTIRSPFAGRVVEIDLHPGEWAAPGTPVITVEDSSQLWVRLDVGEGNFRALAPTQPATIHVIAFPGRSFTGHVMDIGAQGEFAVNRDVKRGRPDLRTFRVRVAFDAPNAALRPGMTAEVDLLADQKAKTAGVAAR